MHTQKNAIDVTNRWLNERHTCSYGWIFEDDSVVDEADVLEWLRSSWSLFAEQMEDTRCQDSVLAVLDELAQVGQSGLLRLRILLNDRDDRVNDRPLVIKSSLATRSMQQIRTGVGGYVFSASGLNLGRKGEQLAIGH